MAEEQTNPQAIRELGRIVAGAYDDHQSVRTSHKNRIRDVIRKKNEGIPFDQKEEKNENKEYSKEYQDKNLPDLLDQMKEEGKLTQAEYDYIHRVLEVSKEAENYEHRYKKLMDAFIHNEPIQQHFLKHITGIGAVLAAKMVQAFGYNENRRHVSELWRYCGYHVVCPNCTETRTDPDTEEEYDVPLPLDGNYCKHCGSGGMAPKRQRGKRITFRPELRTFCWNIADSFVKQKTPVYRQIYDTEKERQIQLMDNGASNAPNNRMQADLRARRKMIKIFLQHYFIASKELSGQEVTKPYPHDKLGHDHYISWREVVHANRKARGDVPE